MGGSAWRAARRPRHPAAGRGGGCCFPVPSRAAAPSPHRIWAPSLPWWSGSPGQIDSELCPLPPPPHLIPRASASPDPLGGAAHPVQLLGVRSPISSSTCCGSASAPILPREGRAGGGGGIPADSHIPGAGNSLLPPLVVARRLIPMSRSSSALAPSSGVPSLAQRSLHAGQTEFVGHTGGAPGAPGAPGPRLQRWARTMGAGSPHVAAGGSAPPRSCPRGHLCLLPTLRLSVGLNFWSGTVRTMRAAALLGPPLCPSSGVQPGQDSGNAGLGHGTLPSQLRPGARC